MRSLLYKLQDTYEISKSSRDLFCATYQYLSRARVRNSPTTRNRDEMRPGLANTVQYYGVQYGGTTVCTDCFWLCAQQDKIFC